MFKAFAMLFMCFIYIYIYIYIYTYIYIYIVYVYIYTVFPQISASPPISAALLAKLKNSMQTIKKWKYCWYFDFFHYIWFNDSEKLFHIYFERKYDTVLAFNIVYFLTFK